MASLAGKVIAVTGAASGIGLSVARIAASRGAKLALADISQESLDKLVAELRSNGVEAVGTPVNVSSRQEVDDWIESTVKHFGRLDGAANIAGVEGKQKATKGIVDQSDEDWDFVLSVNLTGMMYCVRAQLRVMRSGASIVNAASVVSLRGRPNMVAYSVSKHGILGLTRTAAKEVGERGIRVNAFAPGTIETPMLSRVNGEDEQVNRPNPTVPLRRNGSADEVAKVCLFLLSDDAAFVTGAVYTVDGGSMS